MILIPLFLILFNTVTDLAVSKDWIRQSVWTDIIEFIGHPFTALIIATLAAIYFLCIRRGMRKQEILDLSTKALGPAGIIILITGAGGVLKQVLIDSGMGKMMAESLAGSSALTHLAGMAARCGGEGNAGISNSSHDYCSGDHGSRHRIVRIE